MRDRPCGWNLLTQLISVFVFTDLTQQEEPLDCYELSRLDPVEVHA